MVQATPWPCTTLVNTAIYRLQHTAIYRLRHTANYRLQHTAYGEVKHLRRDGWEGEGCILKMTKWL